ncbi:MAG: hypothetical protein WD690_12785, partial [Vicinamibacterales bacterium]
EMPREKREPGEVVPRNLERLFHCLEDVVKQCPASATVATAGKPASTSWAAAGKPASTSWATAGKPLAGATVAGQTGGAACRKRLPLGAMIVHLNDDHGWTREQIAEWLSNGAPGHQASVRS